MNRIAYNLIATTLTTLALSTALPAHAASDGAAFDRVSQTYAAGGEHKWVNTLVSQASVDYVVATEGMSGKAAYGTPVDSSTWSGHEAYDRAFLGIAPSKPGSDSMGKAAYGTTTDSSALSGHEAYDRAFLGIAPSKPGSDSIGKAAFGTSSSGIDGLAAYRNAFHGD